MDGRDELQSILLILLTKMEKRGREKNIELVSIELQDDLLEMNGGRTAQGMIIYVVTKQSNVLEKRLNLRENMQIRMDFLAHGEGEPGGRWRKKEAGTTKKRTEVIRSDSID